MFRIAAKNTTKDHADAAPFQVGNPHDDLDAAKAALPSAQQDYPKSEGYSLTIEQLVDSASGDKSSWEEVK